MRLFRTITFNLICVDGIEADDTMAYISQQLLPKSDIMLMSTDKDFLQLVDDRVKVWSPQRKKLYTKQVIQEEFGLPSRNMLTYRILMEINQIILVVFKVLD